MLKTNHEPELQNLMPMSYKLAIMKLLNNEVDVRQRHNTICHAIG